MQNWTDYHWLVVSHSVPWNAQVRTAEVSWRPDDVGLHYHMLYISIWEYLRKPPSREHLQEAKAYLASLMEYPNTNQLQRDRIRWTRAWIEGLSARRAG